MSKFYESAQDAIENSEYHDETTYCEDTQENRDHLIAECDGLVIANGIREYWKNDEDSDYGMEWRVHIEE